MSNKENRSGLGTRLTEAAHLSISRTNKELAIDSESLDRLRQLKTPVIFAVTHLSNWDTTAFIYCLGKNTNIEAVIAHDSTHNNWFRLVHKISLAIAGNDNFLPVTYRKRSLKNFKRNPIFNPNDYLTMGDRVTESQKSVIMAAYYDPEYCSADPNQVLAEKGGLGVPFLAKITALPVLPVVSFTDPKENRSQLGASLTRPTMYIKVGEPIVLQEEAVDYNAFQTAAERREFLQALHGDSELLMHELAMLLPEEKRGRWGENTNN